MAKFKQLLLQVRYPYTAGVIAVMWLGTATLVVIDSSLPINQLLLVTSISSIIVALLGFATNAR